MPKNNNSKSYSAEYSVWCMARNRCHNPQSKDYKFYGARGVSMCDEWRNDFNAFLRDMGPRPVGMTLDRYPNKDGNYEPNNCRWASWVEQQNNRHDNHLITFQNRTLTLSQWAIETGVNLQTLSTRIFQLKWPPDRALSVMGDARTRKIKRLTKRVEG